MAAKKTPMLFKSPLTGRWFVATGYRTRKGGGFVATTKFDVDDQVRAIIRDAIEAHERRKAGAK